MHLQEMWLAGCMAVHLLLLLLLLLAAALQLVAV
jgi:hypothetical protein